MRKSVEDGPQAMKKALLLFTHRPYREAQMDRAGNYRRSRITQFLSAAILLTASAIGAVAFLMPFISPPEQGAMGRMAHAQDAPLVFFVLVSLSLAAVTADMTAGQMSPQAVAILGVLSAVSAALRLIPAPGGASAFFLIPILGGYVFGLRFGFLLGVFSMLVSAFLTGGVGPWLPYQMFTAGWTGALAGGWGILVRRATAARGLAPLQRGEIFMLALWGGLLGFLYGAIMNLWFWPYVFQAQQAQMYWQPGLGWRETLLRYAAFYLATSLWWDMGRAAGNAVLILAVGRPTVRALGRFRQRMTYTVLRPSSPTTMRRHV